MVPAGDRNRELAHRPVRRSSCARHRLEAVEEGPPDVLLNGPPVIRAPSDGRPVPLARPPSPMGRSDGCGSRQGPPMNHGGYRHRLAPRARCASAAVFHHQRRNGQLVRCNDARFRDARPCGCASTSARHGSSGPCNGAGIASLPPPQSAGSARARSVVDHLGCDPKGSSRRFRGPVFESHGSIPTAPGRVQGHRP